MARTDRTIRWTVPTLAALAFLAVPALASAGPGYVNFMLGQKLFDSDHWDPIDKQTAFGAEGVFGPATWPVSLDAYLSRASKSKDVSFDDGSGGTIDGTADATTYEFGFGVNKTWQRKKFYPYLNAGAMMAKIDVTFHQSGTSVQLGGRGFQRVHDDHRQHPVRGRERAGGRTDVRRPARLGLAEDPLADPHELRHGFTLLGPDPDEVDAGSRVATAAVLAVPRERVGTALQTGGREAADLATQRIVDRHFDP